MNQKDILKALKKHHFWILAGIVSIAALGIYVTAASSMAKTFEERSNAIEGKFTQVGSLTSKTKHPNDNTHKEMELLIQALQGNVRQVWDEQYRHQVTSILVWPRELRPELRRAVRDLKGFKPIEALEFPLPDTQEIPRELREHYRDYIKQELPKMAKLIGAEWKVSLQSRGGGGGYGGGMDMGSGGDMYGGGAFGGAEGGGYGMSGMGGARPKEPEFIVDWNSSNQGHLQNTRFDWGDAAPSTMQMLYAQEDLWVLRALMEIIAKTNEGADSHHKAAIKQITAVEMGVDVGPQRGKVIKPTTPGAGGGMMGEGMGYGEYDMAMMEGTMGESGSGMEAASAMGEGMMDPTGMTMGGGAGGLKSDPAHRRYVDKDYRLLTGTEIRNAQKEGDAEKAYLAVAKRMPVRLRLVMDQRRLQKLLTECGNATLTLEVRQVRINQSGGASGGYGGGGYGGGDMGGMTGMGGMGGMDMGSGGDMYGGGDYGGGSQQKTQSQFDLPIEIYGIIYIYNPANLEKLGIESSQETVAMR